MDYYYSYNSTYGYENPAFIFGYTIGILVFAAIAVISWWRIFSKAGEAGWKAIIPFYNMYTAYKLFWKKAIFFIMLALGVVGAIGYFIMIFGVAAMYMFGGGSGNMAAFAIGLILLLGCSVAALVLQIIFYNRISKAFGHGAGFTVGLVLLNFIFWLILAFGSSRYVTDDQVQNMNNENANQYTYRNPME